MTTFPHPVTGEELPDDAAALRAAATEADEWLAAQYRLMRPVRAALATIRQRLLVDGYVVPRPKYRTQKQESLVRCPNCGGPHVRSVAA